MNKIIVEMGPEHQDWQTMTWKPDSLVVSVLFPFLSGLPLLQCRVLFWVVFSEYYGDRSNSVASVMLVVLFSKSLKSQDHSGGQESRAWVRCSTPREKSLFIFNLGGFGFDFLEWIQFFHYTLQQYVNFKLDQLYLKL